MPGVALLGVWPELAPEDAGLAFELAEPRMIAEGQRIGLTVALGCFMEGFIIWKSSGRERSRPSSVQASISSGFSDGPDALERGMPGSSLWILGTPRSWTLFLWAI